MNVFICETGYHIFLSDVINKENNSEIFIDIKRDQNKVHISYLGEYLTNRFGAVKTFETPSFSKKNNIIIFLSLFLKFTKSKLIVSKLLKTFDQNISYDVYFFTLNWIERLLINSLRKQKNISVHLVEDGLGAYSYNYRFGKDGTIETTNNSWLINCIRTLLGIKINNRDIKVLHYSIPDILDYEIIKRFSEKIEGIPLDIAVLDRISRVAMSTGIQSNSNNQAMRVFFGDLSCKNERYLYKTYLEPLGFIVKDHPKKFKLRNFETSGNIDLFNLPWEYLLVLNENEKVIVCGESTVAYSSIIFSFQKKITVILLHKIEENLNNKDINQYNPILSLQKKFKEKIKTPTDYFELEKLLRNLT